MSGPSPLVLAAAYAAGTDGGAADTLIDCSPGDSTRYRLVVAPIGRDALVSFDDGSGHWHGVEWAGTASDIGRVVECLTRSPWTQQVLRAMLDGWLDGRADRLAS